MWRHYHVAPFAGAWIEITIFELTIGEQEVAPFAGAWIEIDLQDIMLVKNYVAPFAGAWIEIAVVKCNMQYRGSLCSPERGLK